jgi:membrane-bound lytic murein transglycosylase B
MSGLLSSRKGKAATLVPLALLSAVWTASLAGADSAANAAKAGRTTLPGGGSVPTAPIAGPASVPVAGAIAPAVPDGQADSVVAGAAASGIPAVALSAYERAAQIIDAAAPHCNLSWELIAAIGRVESDHGQYGGNVLGPDGVSRPGIYGPVLDGSNGTQQVMDTDHGALDHDPVYDRAVGPMQFLPSTWQEVKVDANGDGKRNPQDINDAALAAAVYLCAGNEHLGNRAGQEAAVFRYNHSQSYVDLVLRIMDAYDAGQYSAIPSGTYGGTVFTPQSTGTLQSRQGAATPHRKPAHTSTGGTGTTTGTTGGGTGTTTTPTPPATPTNPLSQVTKGLTDTLGTITQPVTTTLSTLTEALNFCNTQFAKIPDPLHLLDSAKAQCATKVQGLTTTQATSAIPTSLTAILSWLGLGGLLGGH